MNGPFVSLSVDSFHKFQLEDSRIRIHRDRAYGCRRGERHEAILGCHYVAD